MRKANGPFGGPELQAGTSRTFAVLAGTCNSNAAAYSLNVTVVPDAQLGDLTIWPPGQTQPLVSTLNALTGAITANAAIVSAGSSGDISLYASNDTDIVIDVNGYFAPAGTGGLSRRTVEPCRVLDTRRAPSEI